MDPIELQYATLEEIPEAVRGLFEEKDGAFHLTKVKGLRTDADVTKLSRSLNQERDAHNKLRGQWNGFFGEHKPEDVRAQLDRIPELEALASGKVDDEKINTIVETRTKAKLAPVERELQTTRTTLQERDQQLAQYQAREVRRTIHDRVRDIALKAKVVDTALEDVLMYAERDMETDAEGNVSVKETGLTPEQWLNEMQTKRPHWWPPSAGGGANAGGGGSFANNPWTAENWNMTEQSKVYTSNPQLAERMAAQAGTKVGGLKPAVKK